MSFAIFQAAAALLFVQLLTHGAAGEVQPEELLNAALSEFTDLAQICVPCPFQFGVLDGIVMLLSQLVSQVRKDDCEPNLGQSC